MSNKKWILKDAGESDINYRIFMDETENTEHICDVWRTTDDKQTEVNAKLLAAAAPDLLQAVQEFLLVINKSPTALEYYGDAINRGKAAILKAVGVQPSRTMFAALCQAERKEPGTIINFVAACTKPFCSMPVFCEAAELH